LVFGNTDINIAFVLKIRPCFDLSKTILVAAHLAAAQLLPFAPEHNNSEFHTCIVPLRKTPGNSIFGKAVGV
jgi:hypothetical protein